jgi:glycosyltransferase involved in cell wall biosynthesis
MTSRSDATSPPKVSVVVPVCDRAATIKRCMDSVLRQDFRDLELIVVDDGSRDATRDIVRSVDDQRVRLIEHARNSGASAARNTGIEAARGDYIALLDSDDVFLPGKLSRQIGLLSGCDHRGGHGRISCTAYRIELVDQGRIIEQRPDMTMVSLEGMVTGCNLGPGSTLMAERRVFDRVGLFDTSLRRFEDWLWLLKAVSTGERIMLLDEVLSHVYNRRGRLSRENWEAADRFIEIRNRLVPDLPHGLRRKADFSVWSQVAGTAYYAGDYALLLRAGARAALRDPVGTARRCARLATKLRPRAEASRLLP